MRQLSAPASAGSRKSRFKRCRFTKRRFRPQALNLVHARLHVGRKPAQQPVTVHKRLALYKPLATLNHLQELIFSSPITNN
jgi:hypothetical protein